MELIDVADGVQRWGLQMEQPWLDCADNTEKISDNIACQLHAILAHSRKPVKLNSTRADVLSRSPKFRILKRVPVGSRTNGLAG
jgi:hypothetical protein